MNGSKPAGDQAADPIDMQVIEGLRELGGQDDPGLLVEVIGMFLADAPARIRDLELGLASGDIELLERAAHSLKSASANVGASKLSSICRQIEEIARAKGSERLAELVPESGQAWDEAASVLRSIQG
ncbi:MAG: Hpt domain-containing protein [Planctomycetes bacterium]|nr:Hpt domain-containing protein [Planctomycetota bacterium]